MTGSPSPAASRTSRLASNGKRRVLVALGLTMIVFVMVLGYALARFRATEGHALRTTQLNHPWIRAAGDLSQAAYFRKTFDLPGPVRHAWLKIAAADAFEVNVNRNPLGRQYLWRPTRPFQSGFSEKGQVLSWQDPAMALNFPREYQWDGHDNWRLPTFVELTSSFVPGRNVIAIEAEARLAPARVSFEGEIQLWSGEVIPLRSDDTWLGESSTPGIQLLDWTEIYFWDKEWQNAVICDGPTDRGLRSVPEPIYAEPFTGDWLRHPTVASDSEITFATQWNIDRPLSEAWLRLLCNRSYELYINDMRVRVASTRGTDLDNGNWVFGRGSAHDPSSQPELLDPDEVGSSFVGKQFESPRKADAQLEHFINPFAPKIEPFRYERTHHRAQEAGVLQPKRTMAESRRTPEGPDLFPERPQPNALKHDLSTGGYLSYSIQPLLRVGDNRIEVRCLGKSEANWPTQIAIDGGAFDTESNRLQFPEPSQWTVRDASSSDAPWESVSNVGPAYHPGDRLPSMQYRGVAINSVTFSNLLPKTLVQTLLVTILGVAGVIGACWLVDRFRDRHASLRHDAVQEGSGAQALPLWLSTCETLFAMLLTATVTMLAVILVETSWVERHEVLWCLDGTIWRYAFPIALAASLCVGVIDTLGRVGLHRLREQGHGMTGVLRALPRTKVWVHLIIWILLLGVLLRAYKLDLQPLDDDEYASVQAVLSIMETGAPGFVPDDVYYTRSPLFHYLTALLALPFGGNLWSLRLQTVGWGVGTAWLAYLCGAHLLRSRWVGLISMLLIVLHPFEIFTSHVIRFYQIQQFFALLTVYCFCRGFVGMEPERIDSDTEVDKEAPEDSLANSDGGQSQGWRIATIMVFLCAVLSQEITIALAPSLVIAYLVFAKDLGWQKNVQLAIFSVLAVGLVGLDFIVFQTLCLTRTEGVSPSIEAAVKPHFWFPLNFLSVFIGYSRLHVIPSFFLLCGLPLLWKERNRNTLAFVAFLISGIVMTNLLVTNVSLRYLYWIFPVWLLLSVDGLRVLISTLTRVVYPPELHLNRYVVTSGFCCFVSVAAILASWSLWRVPGSYELRILGDSTGAVRWVRSQKRPGDKLAITEPHTHCAFIEGDKCDYDLAIPLLYDFAVVRDGVLVDRNGGGEVISNLDDLIGTFTQGERVWVVLNREKFRTRGKNMRWEYPGARFELFIRKNCELKYRTYLWSVYLWDPARGHYSPFQLHE
jgi:4-amino-4-deoxy-L-arabinose transferase-like glycosyltransferase